MTIGLTLKQLFNATQLGLLCNTQLVGDSFELVLQLRNTFHYEATSSGSTHNSIQFNSFYFESGIYQIDNISLGLVGRLFTHKINLNTHV